MLKKLLLFIFIAAPLSVCAQDKTAYINAQEIFALMPEFADVQKKLQTKSEVIQKNAKAIEDEYTALIDRFSRDTVGITPSISADRVKQIEQLQERYQNYLQTSQAEFEQDQQKEFTPIRQKLQDVIKQVGDENGFTYIIDAAVLLYVNPSAVDASKLVKAKLGVANK